eukprot:COSAG02_NODE_75_length_41389_cov_106.665762_32_plen_180_part_00
MFAFKLPPLRAHNGPAGGLPRVLSGPSLGNGTRGELRMLADVRFVSRLVLSAPQNRSASLPRHLLSCCSSAPPPPSATPPRARPFDPACRVKQLSIRCFSPPYGSASCCCWCAGRGQGGGEARVAPPSRSSAPSGSGKAVAARSSSSGGGEGEKQIDFGALRSTGCLESCPQTVRQPAS